jgi:hypothetical protein
MIKNVIFCLSDKNDFSTHFPEKRYNVFLGWTKFDGFQTLDPRSECDKKILQWQGLQNRAIIKTSKKIIIFRSFQPA